jgi:hypothetical protein
MTESRTKVMPGAPSISARVANRIMDRGLEITLIVNRAATVSVAVERKRFSLLSRGAFAKCIANEVARH